MKSLVTLLLLAFATFAHGQPDAKDRPMSPMSPMTGLRFPIAPAMKAESNKLTADFLYVIESDAPHLVIASPNGLVTITEEVGPLRIRAKFVDGDGKSETRTYTGKQIWIIEAAGVGKVEILAIPAGATKANQVIRKALDVDAGGGPRPPPGPKKIASHITFVGAEKTIEATATKNDRSLREWLDKAGVKVHTLGADSPSIVLTGLDEAVKAAGGAPCAVLQSEDGKILGQIRMGTTADVWDYTQKFLTGDK